jgi:hypothetical protein
MLKYKFFWLRFFYLSLFFFSSLHSLIFLNKITKFTIFNSQHIKSQNFMISVRYKQRYSKVDKMYVNKLLDTNFFLTHSVFIRPFLSTKEALFSDIFNFSDLSIFYFFADDLLLANSVRMIYMVRQYLTFFFRPFYFLFYFLFLK